MSLLMRSTLVSLFLPGALLVVAAWAGNEGQEDLDRAAEAKLSARSMGDLDEVVRLCRSAIDKGLEKLDIEFANNLLASTLIRRGTVRMEMLARTRATDPKWETLRKDALADFEQSVAAVPKQAEALLSIARLNLLPGGDAKRVSEAIQQAIDCAGDDEALKAQALTLRASIEKDPDKKAADLDAAIRAVPHDAAALRSRALLDAQAEKLDDALNNLDKALELDPKHAPTLELKAMVLAQMKRYDEALVSLDRLSELQPDSAGPLVQKARVHAAQENIDAALHDLNQAASIEPDDATVLLLRAAVYQEMGEYDKALADVEQVLKSEPELPEALRMRATLLAGAGKLDQAIAEMEKLRQKQPEDEMVLLQLGAMYSADKNSPKAIECFSAILKKMPESWIALRSRADLLLNTGKHEEAIADYEKAIKSKPEDPGILNNYAWVLATSPEDKLRDGKRAVEMGTKACELTDYKQAHILSTLAAAYAETGDFKSAIKWAEKAVEVGDDSQHEELRKELESYLASKPWRERIEEP